MSRRAALQRLSAGRCLRYRCSAQSTRRTYSAVPRGAAMYRDLLFADCVLFMCTFFYFGESGVAGLWPAVANRRCGARRPPGQRSACARCPARAAPHALGLPTCQGFRAAAAGGGQSGSGGAHARSVVVCYCYHLLDRLIQSRKVNKMNLKLWHRRRDRSIHIWWNPDISGF